MDYIVINKIIYKNFYKIKLTYHKKIWFKMHTVLFSIMVSSSLKMLKAKIKKILHIEKMFL